MLPSPALHIWTTKSQQPAQHWAVTPLEGQFTVAPAARHDEVVVVAGTAVVVVVVVGQIHVPARQLHPGSHSPCSSLQVPWSHTWQPMQSSSAQQALAAMQVDTPSRTQHWGVSPPQQLAPSEPGQTV